MREMKGPTHWLPKAVVVGVQVESCTARLSLMRGGMLQLQKLPLAELQSVLSKYPDAIVVSALDGADVLLRRLDLEVSKDKDIASVLDFQLEPLLPFSLDEAVVDYMVLERTPEKSTLSVLVAPKSRLQAHLQILQSIGLNPERISCVPVALAQLVHSVLQENGAHAVLLFGQETTVCAVVSAGKVLAMRALSMGLSALTRMGDAPPVDLLHFDPKDHPFLSNAAESLRAEVAKTIMALTARLAPEIHVSQLFVLGALEKWRNMEAYLSTALDIPVAHLPLPAQWYCTAEQLSAFAVPLGLVMGAQRAQAVPPDFRKKELSYPFPWKRGRRRLVTYFSAALILVGAIALFGLARTSHSTDALRNRCGELALALGQQKPALEGLTADEIIAQGRTIQMNVGALPDAFPLVPDVPCVTDFLSWLCSHPKVLAVDKPLIEVQMLRYSLIVRPDNRKPKEHYQVRIDLEFTADSPTSAREFHDALLSESALIDQDKEVKWSSNANGYRTSFVLKDRTRYR